MEIKGKGKKVFSKVKHKGTFLRNVQVSSKPLLLLSRVCFYHIVGALFVKTPFAVQRVSIKQHVVVFMANLPGLALIQSTVSAIGLLLTNIIWDKWQKCHMTIGNKTVIYRTGLWDKCIDHHLIRKTVCTPLNDNAKTTELRSVGVLMVIALCLQSLCVILGLFIYRFAKYRRMISIPLAINIAAALSGLIGLSIYATEKDELNCELSSSYIIGWFGVAEAFLCCLFFAMVAFGG